MNQTIHPDATAISTPLDWEDLVLDEQVRRDVEDIATWILHRDTLLEQWHLKRRLDRGWRCLFHGPRGTGKRLTACLLAKGANLQAYRVDLCQVVAKYAGDMAARLDDIFREAEHGNWLLFFDEADALFGKRTAADSANDRHAEQQAAYLLQRIEDFPGVAILAMNLRAQMDQAFARRFQSIVHFTMPTFEQRLALWQNIFGEQKERLAEDVDFAALARDHELAGGGIVNVLRHACLRAIQCQPARITQQDLIDGIRREASPGASP